MTWPSVALSEVAKIERNGISADQISSGTSYLGLEHIESGGAILGKVNVANGDLASTKFVFTEQHLLYGKLRPYLAKIALPDFGGVCSTDIVPVLPGPHLDRRFLAYYLRQPAMVEYANSRATGANLPRLSPKSLAEVPILLPPLDEQRRIAEILDQADALRRLRARALDKLNILGQAIFHEMFGDTRNSQVKKLKDVAQLINGDRSSSYPSGDEIKEHGILFLSTKNIREWRLDLTQTQFITEEKFAALSRGKLQRGDIVITLRGTLGQAAIFDCAHETGFINAQMMIIRPSAELGSKYLLDYLAHDRTQYELSKGQSGSAVKQLTAKQIGELPVVVPTVEQQTIYSEKMAACDETRVSAIQQSGKAETLFTSLQHRAFRGEL